MVRGGEQRLPWGKSRLLLASAHILRLFPMCVCMYVPKCMCMYVPKCVHVYPSMCVSIYVYMFVCACVCIHVCVCMSECIVHEDKCGHFCVCVCTCMPVFMHVYVCVVCACLCLRVYVCVHMCVHMWMYVWVCICVLLSITRWCRNAVLNASEWWPYSWKSQVWAAPRALSSFSFIFRGSGRGYGSDSLTCGRCQGGSFLRQCTVTFCLRNHLRGWEVWDGEGESACGKGTPWTRRGKTGRAWDGTSERTSGKWGDLIPYSYWLNKEKIEKSCIHVHLLCQQPGSSE